jgi:hypothetical protein
MIGRMTTRAALIALAMTGAANAASPAVPPTGQSAAGVTTNDVPPPPAPGPWAAFGGPPSPDEVWTPVPPPPAGSVAAGREAYDSLDYISALRIWRPLAERNDVTTWG